MIKISSQFSKQLKKWHKANHRPMPWLDEKEPYKIWISEIILQQTRVKQGWKYYENFIAKFPNVDALADAHIDDVMKQWEGLGYYSRARNLHHSAKLIQSDYKSVFPSNYEDILQLKGIGPYTAAAISSFAYNLPYAVVDGNVKRVYARLYGVTDTKGTKPFDKQIQLYAEQHLDKKKPGVHNQAIINFGAIQCLPKNPNCNSCTMSSFCIAYQKEMVAEIPKRSIAIVKQKRYLHYIHVSNDDTTLIKLRGKKDIWRQLYDLPQVDTDREKPLSEAEIGQELKTQWSLRSRQYVYKEVNGPYHQMLTHRHIVAYFYKIMVDSWENVQLPEGVMRIDSDNIDKYAKPKVIDIYLKDKSLYLF